jgi:hypothetical protein
MRLVPCNDQFCEDFFALFKQLFKHDSTGLANPFEWFPIEREVFGYWIPGKMEIREMHVGGYVKVNIL